MRRWEGSVRVLLVPNTANAAAVSAAVELATYLAAKGLDPVLWRDDAGAVGLGEFGVAATDIGVPALVVALGGDGTILKAVHLLGEVESPVLGVKFGRLGFLSGARSDRMREAVEAALAGDVSVERRATLSIEVVMEGRTVGRYRALNEVVLSRGASPRVIGIEVAVNGHRLMRTRADGLVVATATGSTAYALSAGGPIVTPGFAGMVVVPVAPHTLMARPVLTEPAATIELSLSDPSRSEACLLVDGDLKPCRRAIERVVVTHGEHDVALVKLDGRDFYETVSAEFFGG